MNEEDLKKRATAMLEEIEQLSKKYGVTMRAVAQLQFEDTSVEE